MKHPQVDHFETHVRDLYLRAGPRVDSATAVQLRAARRNALANGQRRQTMRTMRWMVPTGAVAVALLAVVTVWQPLQRRTTLTPATTHITDTTQALPPDAGQTDPTLYQNMGFYAWLAQQPATRHANGRH